MTIFAEAALNSRLKFPTSLMDFSWNKKVTLRTANFGSCYSFDLTWPVSDARIIPRRRREHNSRRAITEVCAVSRSGEVNKYLNCNITKAMKVKKFLRKKRRLTHRLLAMFLQNCSWQGSLSLLWNLYGVGDIRKHPEILIAA